MPMLMRFLQLLSNIAGPLALLWLILAFNGYPAEPAVWLGVLWLAGRGKAFWFGALLGLFTLND